jgi:hypothetical protein
MKAVDVDSNNSMLARGGGGIMLILFLSDLSLDMWYPDRLAHLIVDFNKPKSF